MVEHDHREHVEGCFRCELGKDEVEFLDDELECHCETIAEFMSVAPPDVGTDAFGDVTSDLDALMAEDIRFHELEERT